MGGSLLFVRPGRPHMSELVQVLGLKELEAKLLAIGLEFGPKAAASPVRSALRKGGIVIQKSAVGRVRRKSGTLAENIIVTSHGQPPRDGFIDMKVTVRAKAKAYKVTRKNIKAGTVNLEYQSYGPLFYARFLEFGTSHQPAYPFLRPAFEENKEAVLPVIRDALSAAIDKTIARLKGAGK